MTTENPKSDKLPATTNSADDGEIVTLCDGDIRAWIDGGIHLKAVTRFGDPVELSPDEAQIVVDELLKLIDKAK